MIAHEDFAPRLLAWQRAHGRHDLPWQRTRDPYRIWLSEVMLQQTQVATVIPYYARFLARCPDVAALAALPDDDVMTLWSGLGYYSRARNLHRCAQQVMTRFGGRFPENAVDLASLPGIGRSTAAAIAAFAFGRHEAILDGNVKRVLARVFGIEGFPGEKRIETAMWTLAESLLPMPPRGVSATPSDDDMSRYTQGLMDLGATLCTRANPDCPRCPFAADCVANLTHRQRELPTRRAPKVTPTRRTVMLILEAEPFVLLHRRPPTGVWGGLWSLPEVEDEAQARDVAREFGGQPESFSRLTPFVHAFTHFRLEIAPVRIACGEPQGGRLLGTPDAPVAWVDRRDLDRYGLPAPVRRILDALHGSLI
ncbi:A/G-specific adenine glycosylase [Robbsia sp. Bb-Pol-6]|uniref:Adenine DNA glycosylase n=1 Tax=Robbsia betulipollinis TaxID=2981849 RepID=A0ABT3ZLM2_9BURK|nr:A/G-specific adenine glycosylase [Robbsia betulipollinis]MCY0387180.1 A/G-specific adenine glycosylase [Robbsia betulipollinis]